MKECTKCHEMKPLSEFTKSKSTKDGLDYRCKACQKIYREENKEEIAEYKKDLYHNRGGREKSGKISMYKNKTCSNYIGIVVGERLIKHLFDNVTMMPFGHPGFDAICQHGKRINVKASTIRVKQNKNSTTNYWDFNIEYNKDCDFFLCMAFDNVIDLHPLNAWLIPGKEVNTQSGIQISATTLERWDKWKMDMDNAQQCCDLMKKVSNDE